MKQKKESYLEENIENAEEIRKKIHEETDYETKEIISRAKALAASIINEARQQADKDKQEALSRLEKKITIIKERIFSALNLEKKKVVMGEKSKFINEVFCEVASQAKLFRERQEYAIFLKEIILKAAKVLSVSNLEVIYSFMDDKLINDSFIKEAKSLCQNKLGQEISLKFSKDDFSDIGFIVQSVDGRLIYDGRFTSRFKMAQDDIYMDLLRKL